MLFPPRYGLYGISDTKMCYSCCTASLADDLDFYYCDRLRADGTLEEMDLRNRYIQSRWTKGRMKTLVFSNINSYSSGKQGYRGDLGKQRP